MLDIVAVVSWLWMCFLLLCWEAREVRESDRERERIQYFSVVVRCLFVLFLRSGIVCVTMKLQG